MFSLITQQTLYGQLRTHPGSHVMLSMPPGCGKTTMLTQLIKNDTARGRGINVFVVHANNLTKVVETIKNHTKDSKIQVSIYTSDEIEKQQKGIVVVPKHLWAHFCAFNHSPIKRLIHHGCEQGIVPFTTPATKVYLFFSVPSSQFPAPSGGDDDYTKAASLPRSLIESDWPRDYFFKQLNIPEPTKKLVNNNHKFIYAKRLWNRLIVSELFQVDTHDFDDNQECPICREQIMFNKITTGCCHTFCFECIAQHYAQYYNFNTQHLPCPLCRSSLMSPGGQIVMREQIYDILSDFSPLHKNTIELVMKQDQPRIILMIEQVVYETLLNKLALKLGPDVSLVRFKDIVGQEIAATNTIIISASFADMNLFGDLSFVTDLLIESEDADIKQTLLQRANQLSRSKYSLPLTLYSFTPL